MESGVSPTLVEKLYNIMSDVSYIQKDRKNTFHNYTYASEAAIKNAVHSALAKYRVLFFPVQAHVMSLERGHGAKQDENLTTIKLSYEFINVDNPTERLSGSFEGTGSDKGDKGAYKAITGAIKYALTSTFLIETGDQVAADPENDEPPADKDNSPAARKQDAKIAAQEAQLIAQRKIQDLQKEQPKPKLEVPPAFQKILDNVGTSKDLILAKLSDLSMELLESYGENTTKYATFQDSLLARYGAKTFPDMPVADLRRVLYHVWKEIELGAKREPQENPVLQKVVAEMPIGTGADSPPFWVSEPWDARKDSPEYAAAEARKQAGTSYDENTKGKRGKK